MIFLIAQESLEKVEVDVLVLDIAHGHSLHAIEAYPQDQESNRRSVDRRKRCDQGGGA